MSALAHDHVAFKAFEVLTAESLNTKLVEA